MGHDDGGCRHAARHDLDRAATQHREQLFNRIARELDLGWEDRLSLSLGSNYGSLLILDWLVADLPHRLPAAIGILKSAASKVS